jgi:UDP-N-acetylmuramate dehydrogenase
MLQFAQYANLKTLNTLNLNSTARYLATVDTEQSLQAVLNTVTAKRLPLFILLGGSNVLLPEQVNALVIRPLIKGIQLIQQDEQHVWVEVMAGEEWHPFVQFCLQQGWFGLENLSLIPGYVGASPIQNIGAYGVEVGDYIESVKAWHIAQQQWITLNNDQCQFAYRDSIFKQQAGQWVISRVRFKLRKQPKLMLGYGDVAAQAGRHPTPQSVAQAITQIRQSKLPDPKLVPNVGSFFKNPVIEASHFERLKQQHPALVGYPQANHQVKIAAGWLIEQAGWKGRQLGSVGMYAKQALVLVNHGVAGLQEVNQLSRSVQQSVLDQFDVQLEQEPVQVSF